MADKPLESQTITSQLIASLAARTALETPGVLRLEPTVLGFLARIGPAALRNLQNPGSKNGTYQHDGVTATITEDTVRIQLDIATDISYTALNVAATVQHRVRENIMHTGLTPGRVDISILAIEPESRGKIA